MKLSLLLLFFSVFLVGCGETTEEDKCTGQDCGFTHIDTTSSVLSFQDTKYFHLNDNRWVTVTSEQANSHNLGTIPHFNIPYSITEASDYLGYLFKNPTVNPALESERDYELVNTIVFVQFNVKNDYEYKLSYQKLDQGGRILGQKGEFTKSVIINDGRGYIPLHDQFFNGSFFSENNGVAIEDISHSISIKGVGPGGKVETNMVKFKIYPESKKSSLNTILDQETIDFTLKNRWQNYYSTEGIPNQNFKLATVNAGNEIEGFNYDLRVNFRDIPVARISQSIFVQEIFDLEFYKITGLKVFRRGENFFSKDVILDSSKHFNLKFTLSGEEATLNQTELLVENIDASKSWNIGFAIDFRSHDSYTSGKKLLTPLKPECHIARNKEFFPTLEANQREQATLTGRYYSICHPDFADSKLFTNEEIARGDQRITDTWYDFFSYQNYSVIQDTEQLSVVNWGHFLGIQEVSILFEGCVKVQSRETGTLDWSVKTQTDEECTFTGEEGWAFIRIHKKDSIFNYVNEYASNLELTRDIQNLGKAARKTIESIPLNEDSFTEHFY
jgi:hypothetical protein